MQNNSEKLFRYDVETLKCMISNVWKSRTYLLNYFNHIQIYKK